MSFFKILLVTSIKGKGIYSSLEMSSEPKLKSMMRRYISLNLGTIPRVQKVSESGITIFPFFLFSKKRVKTIFCFIIEALQKR